MAYFLINKKPQLITNIHSKIKIVGMHYTGDQHSKILGQMIDMINYSTLACKLSKNKLHLLYVYIMLILVL